MDGSFLHRALSSSTRNSQSTSTSVSKASKILFIIDDIHFADESSLKHLLTLGSHRKCLLILSMKPPTNNNNDRPSSNTIQTISTDSRVYLRRLPSLELRYLATLGKPYAILPTSRSHRLALQAVRSSPYANSPRNSSKS